MRVLAAVLAVSAVIVLGIAAFEAIPAPSNGPAHGIVWAGQTFATRAQFARWLRSEGTTYRAWARSHPVEAGLVPRQDHSGWGPGVFAVIAAFLGALALGVALVRRRWPESGAATAHLIEVMGVRGAAAIGAGARTTGRWAAPRARRSMAIAAAGASSARRRTGASTRHLIEVMRPKGGPATEARGRRTGRWAAPRPRRSIAVAAAGASSDRRRTAASTRHLIGVRRLRGAAAREARHRGARPRGAALTAKRLTALATVAAFNVHRRRPELAWYVTTALLAAGMGIIVTVWLNRGP